MFRKILCLSAMFLALAFGQAAFASTITAGGGDGVSVSTWHPLLLNTGWIIGPRSVSADPDAGAWLKKLQTPAYLGGRSDTFYLLEILRVGNGPAWTDWHEEILTPGWEWEWGKIFTLGSQDAVAAASSFSVFQSFSPGAAIPSFFSPIATGEISGDSIDFHFDALDPSTWVFVLKSIEWTGGEGARISAPIRIVEYPSAVPIPAAIWMLGSGLVGLAAFKRHKL